MLNGHNCTALSIQVRTIILIGVCIMILFMIRIHNGRSNLTTIAAKSRMLGNVEKEAGGKWREMENENEPKFGISGLKKQIPNNFK